MSTRPQIPRLDIGACFAITGGREVNMDQIILFTDDMDTSMWVGRGEGRGGEGDRPWRTEELDQKCCVCLVGWSVCLWLFVGCVYVCTFACVCCVCLCMCDCFCLCICFVWMWVRVEAFFLCFCICDWFSSFVLCVCLSVSVSAWVLFPSFFFLLFFFCLVCLPISLPTRTCLWPFNPAIKSILVAIHTFPHWEGRDAHAAARPRWQSRPNRPSPR